MVVSLGNNCCHLYLCDIVLCGSYTWHSNLTIHKITTVMCQVVSPLPWNLESDKVLGNWMGLLSAFQTGWTDWTHFLTSKTVYKSQHWLIVPAPAACWVPLSCAGLIFTDRLAKHNPTNRKIFLFPLTINNRFTSNNNSVQNSCCWQCAQFRAVI